MRPEPSPSSGVGPGASRPPGDDCPVCGRLGIKALYEVENVPTNSCILLPTPEEARDYPRGDIRLACCPGCGFIFNRAFDPILTEYSQRYEETQIFSDTFSSFHRELGQNLIERHGLRNKDILEIGCGKGEFLALLVGLGGNRGVGFDPGFSEERRPGDPEDPLVFRKELFTREHGHMEADFICCKMTLEHIHRPRSLLSAVRAAASNREGTVVFFQVPDVTRVLVENAFEDVYFEHASYFGPASLARLFGDFGFRILNMETLYHGQYLGVEASLGSEGSLGGGASRGVEASDGGGEGDGPPPVDGVSQHLELAARFSRQCPERVRRWDTLVKETVAEGKKVVLWGSGSKAVSFLTTLPSGPLVRHVVDINPYRQGHFMPGTGQPILAPKALVEDRPDLVVILNRVYREEIKSNLDDLGVSPEVVVL